ncbi:MAG: serine/threonine-protein kinase [Ruminococcus sp.]|nr:serine/threonine-protein kinase [Ruminococcus sp.]
MNSSDLIEVILKQLRQPLWDNWYIQEKIGSGSFSAVYRITAKRLSRTDVSAVKIEPLVPADDSYTDEARRRRLIEERRQLAVNESNIMFSLRDCPNIVSYQEEDLREFYIDGHFEGYCFLIRMEYLSCLSDLIKEKKFDFSEKNVRKVAADIGNGLLAAHDKGIIHRDLKPGNFFCDNRGVYKLGDFNISKKADISGTFAGTNGYLAPEVYLARSNAGARYGKQADIYSFGICLYQLMNDMYMPFEKELLSIEEAIDRRMSGAPLPPPQNASQQLARIILKACAFDPAQRYRTLRELLDDLNKAPESGTAFSGSRTTLRLPQHQGFDSGANPFHKNAPAAAKPRPEAPASRPMPQQERKRTVVKPEKHINPVPVAAFLLTLIAVSAIGFTAYKLSGSEKSRSSGSTGGKITEISANMDMLSIGLHEDVDITSVTFPDSISRNAAELDSLLQTGYEMTSTLYATNDQLVITVNDDADEKLKWDAPEALIVSADKSGDDYNITFNAENYLGRDAVCKVVFYCDDQSVYKEIQVNITNDGPFQDEVMMRSSDPDIISIYEENGGQNYKINSAGTAVINWIYNGEIKYSKEVTVTD